MPQEISDRLRQVKEDHGWSAKKMAEMCGIPKRSMESYMLLRNPPQPGLDALKSLSTGLNVSLDWLVFGPEVAAKRAELTARIGAHEAASDVISKIFKLPERLSEAEAQARIIEGKTLHTWCDDLARIAGANAAKLAAAKPAYQALAKENGWRELLVLMDLVTTKEAMEKRIEELRKPLESD